MFYSVFPIIKINGEYFEIRSRYLFEMTFRLESTKSAGAKISKLFYLEKYPRALPQNPLYYPSP